MIIWAVGTTVVAIILTGILILYRRQVKKYLPPACILKSKSNESAHYIRFSI